MHADGGHLQPWLIQLGVGHGLACRAGEGQATGWALRNAGGEAICSIAICLPTLYTGLDFTCR